MALFRPATCTFFVGDNCPSLHRFTSPLCQFHILFNALYCGINAYSVALSQFSSVFSTYSSNALLTSSIHLGSLFLAFFTNSEGMSL